MRYRDIDILHEVGILANLAKNFNFYLTYILLKPTYTYTLSYTYINLQGLHLIRTQLAIILIKYYLSYFCLY